MLPEGKKEQEESTTKTARERCFPKSQKGPGGQTSTTLQNNLTRECFPNHQATQDRNEILSTVDGRWNLSATPQGKGHAFRISWKSMSNNNRGTRFYAQTVLLKLPLSFLHGPPKWSRNLPASPAGESLKRRTTGVLLLPLNTSATEGFPKSAHPYVENTLAISKFTFRESDRSHLGEGLRVGKSSEATQAATHTTAHLSSTNMVGQCKASQADPLLDIV